MFEFLSFLCRRGSAARLFSLAPLAWGSLTLSGCVLLNPPDVTPAEAAASAASAPASAPAPTLPPSAPPAPPPRDEVDEAGHQMLRWQEEIRQNVEPAAARIARLSAEPPSPAVSVNLALALLQTRVPGDAGRAVGILDTVIRSTEPSARGWVEWARFLQSRAVEQRRLEESVDRLNQQLRDSQRRIDQATEKLEALKAIERSLAPHRPAMPGASR